MNTGSLADPRCPEAESSVACRARSESVRSTCGSCLCVAGNLGVPSFLLFSFPLGFSLQGNLVAQQTGCWTFLSCWWVCRLSPSARSLPSVPRAWAGGEPPSGAGSATSLQTTWVWGRKGMKSRSHEQK